ncbi:MAG: hypothetical protein ABW321_33210 [Polyangiales bacterium]
MNTRFGVCALTLSAACLLLTLTAPCQAQLKAAATGGTTIHYEADPKAADAPVTLYRETEHRVARFTREGLAAPAAAEYERLCTGSCEVPLPAGRHYRFGLGLGATPHAILPVERDFVLKGGETLVADVDSKLALRGTGAAMMVLGVLGAAIAGAVIASNNPKNIGGAGTATALLLGIGVSTTGFVLAMQPPRIDLAQRDE